MLNKSPRCGVQNGIGRFHARSIWNCSWISWNILIGEILGDILRRNIYEGIDMVSMDSNQAKFAFNNWTENREIQKYQHSDLQIKTKQKIKNYVQRCKSEKI